jgi:hypothetical protein
MPYNEKNPTKGFIMEIEIEEVKSPVIGTKHEFARLILGTAAGFLATKAVAQVYDQVLARRTNKTPDITPE